MGYTPIAIEQKSLEVSSPSDITIPGLSGRIKLKDIAVFSRQFATMINSGLSLIRALAILTEQTENKQLAKVVGEVRLDVERGSSLSAAMSKHPKVFNHLYIAMVKSGEAGGVLDAVLTRLADTIEKQVELRRKVKSAMTYPIVVLVICSVIATAMLLLIVPQFKAIYADLGGTLPLPTRVLISISDLLKTFFPIFVLLRRRRGLRVPEVDQDATRAGRSGTRSSCGSRSAGTWCARRRSPASPARSRR